MSKPLDKDITSTNDREFNTGTQTLPNDTFNNNLSARPKSTSDGINIETDASIEDQVDFGEMNLEDAVESGYVNEDGKAVSTAKSDVTGSPTGAYTDIGAGRSSAVHHPAKNTLH